MSQLKHIRIDDLPGGVRRLTLNRPEAFNALSTELMTALLAALDAADEDGSIRTLIIAGAGRGFCAGHDLKEVRDLADPAERLALFELCSRLMLRLQTVRQPVIAQVHGMAAAAGCQLVASCDLAVAEAGARFMTPGVNIGLFCSTPMVALSRAVPRKQALEMLMTGDTISAERAADIGLINRAVPSDALAAETEALAAKIASKSSLVLKIGKQAFYEQAELPTAQAYAYTAQVMTDNLAALDAAEGIQAFIEKRKPSWSDS